MKSVDIAILTVIQVELKAALEVLGLEFDAKQKDADGNYSWRGEVHSSLTNRLYSVVVRVIGSAGNADAASAATALLKDVRPRVLLLVGIAAGIRGKIKIGDVVLSERVVGYESAVLEKTKKGRKKTIPRPEIARIDYPLEQDVVTYFPQPAELQAAFEKIDGSFPVPPAGQDEEYKEHVATTITVRQATVASGEKLLKDPTKLTSLRTNIHGRIEIGEMEATGIATACRRMGTPWLVIRGVSDFGDEFKSDLFHVFAAKTAAVVLANFIQRGLHLDYGEPKGPSHPETLDFKHLVDLSTRVSNLIRPVSDSPSFDIRIGLAPTFERLLTGEFTESKLKPIDLQKHTLHMRLLLIHAPGGSGKTAVLSDIAREEIAAGKIVFFLDLKTGSSSRPLPDMFSLDDLFNLYSIAGNAESFHQAIDNGLDVLLLVDGLNEVYGPLSESILTRMDRFLLDHSNLRIIVADRMNPHPDSFSSRATIEPLALDEIKRLLPKGVVLPRQPAELQLLSTPFFLDLQLSLWANMKATSLKSKAVLARKEMFLRYFAQSANITVSDLPTLAGIAFSAYEKYRGRTFDPDWWRQSTPLDLATRLDQAGVTVDTVTGGERKKMFRHQLLHDFLTGYYVAETPAGAWTSDFFDAATFKANAAEPLSFAAELLADKADDFLIQVYDWSYRTVDRCIADLNRSLVKSPVSRDLQVALIVKNAEKKFDVFEETARDSERSLLDAALPEARTLNEAKSIEDVLRFMQSFRPSTQTFKEWKKVFLWSERDVVDEQMLLLLDSNPITGWTTANSLRRLNLSATHLAQVRMMYYVANKEEKQTLRWRIVHLLGRYPSSENIHLLQTAILSDPYEWARYGAIRSLMEIASTQGGVIMQDIIDNLITELENIKSALTIREIRRTCLVRGANRDWYDAVRTLAAEAMKMPEAEPECDAWKELLAEIDKRRTA